jgi:hypothetical protein
MIITGTVCWPPFKSVLSGLWMFAITILKMRSAGLGTARRGANSSAWGSSHSLGSSEADYDDVLTDFTYMSVNI